MAKTNEIEGEALNPNDPNQQPQLDENGNPIQLDENGQPIPPDGQGVPPPGGIAPIPQDGQAMPGADPNQGQVPVDGQPVPADQAQQSYYNDPEAEPDGDEDYDDTTGANAPMQKGIALMEPTVTDSDSLAELIKGAVREAQVAGQAPLIAKMNELLKGYNANKTEFDTLKAMVTEQNDLIKSFQGQMDVLKASDPSPAAKPAEPEASSDPVVKAADATGATTIDPAAVATPGGVASASDKLPKLIVKARDLRDDLSKSWDGSKTSKADFVKALAAAQNNPSEANTLALEVAVNGVG